MSFGIGALAAFAGLLALAGLFFLLQRLRVRHRLVVVETTLFWKQAIEDARARVFVERFRHPLVYALLLLIGSLLWLAFARTSWRLGPLRDTLVLFDASAGMGVGDRFALARDEVLRLTAGLDPERRRVVLCAERPRTLLAPGEHAQLLRERLEGMAPAAVPSTVEQALRTALHVKRDLPLDVVIVGCSAPDPSLVAALSSSGPGAKAAGPADVRVRRVVVDGLSDAASLVLRGNRGITALGSSAAKSAAPDRADILVEVGFGQDADAVVPRLWIDGAVFEAVDRVERSDVVGSASGGLSHQRFVFRDIVSRGQEVEVRLPADGILAADDVARAVLPRREPLRVVVLTELPAAFERALAVDVGLEVLRTAPRDGKHVVIRRGGGSLDGGGLSNTAPALVLVDEPRDHAFFFHCDATEDASAALASLHARLGLGEVDATEIATKTRRAITAGAAQAERRGIEVWSELFSKDHEVATSRALPLFVSLGLRWIAGLEDVPATAPIGSELAFADQAGGSVTTGSVKVQDATGRWIDSGGAKFRPAAGGTYVSERGTRFAATLLDPLVTAGTTLEHVEEHDAAAASFDLVPWLLLLATVLLVVEWILFQHGRIP